MSSPTTILFTDIEGSTQLQTTLGDSEARRVVERWEEVAIPLVHEHGGQVLKYLGDGLMITFDSPRAGVTCALDITAATLGYNRRNPTQSVRIRAGLHTGDVIDSGTDIHGGAVSAAARICDHAEGGEVLVSDVVRQLCGSMSDADFIEHGNVQLRGFPNRWQIHRAGPSGERRPLQPRWPFVGRDQARADLRALLTAAASGEGSLAMIGGEAGVGKTRFLSEVAREARQRGMWVSVGHCHDNGRMRPYAPFLEMIETAMRVWGDDFAQFVGPTSWAISQFIPGLDAFLPETDAPTDIPGDSHRDFVVKAVQEMLLATTALGPHILIVEDLHWADESTMLVFDGLVDQLDSESCLLLASYRDTTADRTDPLTQTLAAQIRHRNAHLFTLARHTEAEVAEMITMAAGETPPDIITAALYEISNGNALFVEEMYRHLMATGQLIDDRGHLRTDLDLDVLDVPANARLLIERRIADLRPETQRLLEAAAVLGQRSSFSALCAVSHLDEDAVIDAIEEAESASVLVEDRRARLTIYTFSHELLRRAVLGAMSAVRRERSHLRAATAIENVGDAGNTAAEIADHLMAAGDNADESALIDASIEAGRIALAATAFERAERYLTRALDLVPRSDTLRRASVLVSLGHAHRSMRDWEEAEAVWDRALSALELEDASEEIGALCFEIARMLAWAYRFEEMAEITVRGLAGVEGTGSAHVARLMAAQALAVCLSGDGKRGIAMFDEARQLAASHRDPSARIDVQALEPILNYFLMQFPTTAAIGMLNSEWLRNAGDHWLLADELCFVAFATAHQAKFDEWREVEAELVPLANRLGHSSAQLTTLRIQFVVNGALRGDINELAQIASTKWDLSAATGNAGVVASAHTALGMVDFWAGRWPQASASFDKGVEMAGAFFGLIQRGAWMMFRAWCGETAAVTDLYDELRPLLPRLDAPNLLAQWNLAVFAAEAIGIVGDSERAGELVPMIDQALDTGALTRHIDGRLLRTSSALVAAAAGLDDKAERDFEAALALATTLPHRLEQPAISHHFGAYLLGRGQAGDEPRAIELLTDASRGYDSLGMPRHRAVVDDLLSG